MPGPIQFVKLARPAGRPIHFFTNGKEMYEMILVVGRPSGRPPKETFHTGLRHNIWLNAQIHI